ncbi:hypothetical protein B296_00027539 [Ensete ventricosum]|uniref:Ketopantoate reductase C-terminal domain-containing protein n=1 Tax=Ensete ventricosum TaxID=4639 RepID=A0A427APJ1_ENSVE|nr:hypothetical protein B296_00027539 [Ensete ventricosum]
MGLLIQHIGLHLQLLGGIGSTIAQGMAFGTIAHRAVDAVVGPRTIQHETVVSEAAVDLHPSLFLGKLNGLSSDIAKANGVPLECVAHELATLVRVRQVDPFASEGR